VGRGCTEKSKDAAKHNWLMLVSTGTFSLVAARLEREFSEHLGGDRQNEDLSIICPNPG
jgi:hypothetical protein